MTAALIIAAGLAAWLAVGMCVGMLFGRWIRLADEHAERQPSHREQRR